MTKLRESLESWLFYHLFKWSVVAPMFNVYFRGRVYGVEKVPQLGPLVVVSNHASDFDPVLLSCCMRRPVAYMAKQELFRVPILKQAISLYGAYPVNRQAPDRSAIKSALSYLDEGWATGVFLQGTRTAEGRITEPKLGAALIAAKAKVPLLPVCLWGTQGIIKNGSPIPKFVPLTVRVGDLIEPPSSTKRDELEALTQKCADVINKMHDLGR